MTSHISPLVSGAVFGLALVKSDLWLRSTTLDQLALQDDHMLRTYLCASAFSALIIYAVQRSGSVKLPYRSNTSYGWFGSYDANIVGGVLQGLGLALTGACPGTMIVQAALGIEGALWMVGGGVLGGLGYVLYGESLKGQERSGRQPVTGHTLAQRLNTNDGVALLGYEVILALVYMGVGSNSGRSDVSRRPTSPLTGGALVGIAQMVSILASRKTLGISSAYQEVAALVVSVSRRDKISSAFSNIVFACGVAVGAKLLTAQDPAPAAVNLSISSTRAIVGGFTTIFGARLAGGCTSGHCISGTGTLSVSSLITAASISASGVLFKYLLTWV